MWECHLLQRNSETIQVQISNPSNKNAHKKGISDYWTKIKEPNAEIVWILTEQKFIEHIEIPNGTGEAEDMYNYTVKRIVTF